LANSALSVDRHGVVCLRGHSAAVPSWIILRVRARTAIWGAIAIAIGGAAIMGADESGSVVLKGSPAVLGSAFGFAVLTVALRWRGGRSAAKWLQS